MAQRSLEAPLGGLPEESLEPLLRVRQDSLYSPQDVKRDIALLVQIGDFDQVEAVVDDAVLFDEAGDPFPAVTVTYRVYPPARVSRVDVSGNRAFSDRDVRGAIGVERGDAWFGGETELARRLTAAYVADGYPLARATIAVGAEEASRQVSLRVDVEEGAPVSPRTLVVRETPALSTPAARRILARKGVRVRAVLTPAELAAGRDHLLRKLREQGWYEARVAVEVDGETLGVLVEPGRRWEIVRVGADLPRVEEIAALLGLDRGPRLGRSWEVEAGRRIVESLQAEGFLSAEARVSLEDKAESVRVTVEGSRGPRHRLRDVSFAGAEGVSGELWSPKYLRGAFREAAADTLSRRRITPADVDSALEALQEFYRAQGYLGVRFQRAGFTPDARGAKVVPVDVAVDVTPGPRATLGRVEVVGAAEGIDTADLFEPLRGLPLNPAEIEARTRRLVEQHTNAGHLGADARARLVVAPGGEVGDVRVEVSPGPVVYLRSTLIKGHRRTRRSVIEEEVDLRPGEPLSAARIEDVRRRLYDLGVFSRVEVEPTGDEDRIRDLLVTVEEKKNLYFEAGGGVATDEGLRVFLRGGHRNVLGYAHQLSLYGDVGVGWQGDSWVPAVDEPEWRAALRYEAVHVPTRGERLAVDLLANERQQEELYRIQRTGLGLGLLVRLGRVARAEFGPRLQVRQLLDVDPGVLVPGDPWLDELGATVANDAVDPASVSTPSDPRLQATLGLSIFADTRDDPANPRRGGLGAVSIELATNVFGDTSFLRMDSGWTSYVPLGGLSLLLRGRGGIGLLPEEGTTLPLEDRFWLGGGASFRGFALDSMGPANVVPREDIDWPAELEAAVAAATSDAADRVVPTGGDAMAVGTVELWLPFDQLGAKGLAGTSLALFADVGNTWLLSAPADTELGDPALRFSVGLGLRRATPVGPIQVDLGLNPFPLEGRGETRARVHLSLGAL